MAVRPRIVALPPRELFRPWDAEAFGNAAHDDWYRAVIRWGDLDRHTLDSAVDWWHANVAAGDGWYAYGMRHPSTKAEVKSAYRHFVDFAIELYSQQYHERHFE